MLHNVNHTTYLLFWTLEHIFPCSFHFVQLLISKNKQQIPHGNIQIVQRGKLDTLSTYIQNRSLSLLRIYTFKLKWRG